MEARYIDKKEIVITQEGIEVRHPGDVVVGESEEGTEVRQLHGATPKNPDSSWDAGRPIEVMGEDRHFVVNRLRIKKTRDMDTALPQEVLRRRKKLILDRMKQERS